MALTQRAEINSIVQSEALPKRSFNYKLEFLRGVAALLVVYHHAIVHKFVLDPAYIPSGIWKFEAPGHLSVLVFFVLSGYVIQLTNAAPLAGQKIAAYLKKRFVRIYPIYAVTIACTWLAFFHKYPLKILFGNLVFLQIFKEQFFMWELSPVWSLDFEVIFYLLFIFISRFRINMKLVFVTAFLIPLGLLLLLPNGLSNRYLVQYPVFLCFWISGAIIADKYRNADWQKMNFVLLMSSVCSFISLEYFDVLHTLLNKVLSLVMVSSSLNDSSWVASIGTIKDLSYLPFCIIIILLFAGAESPYLLYSYYALQAINALTLVYIAKHRHEGVVQDFAIPTAFFLASIALLLLQKNKKLNLLLERFMRKGALIGSISYGLYIIHFPILTSFKSLHVFSGSEITFVVRFFILLGLALLAAYLLEKKLQPLAGSFFSKKKA